MFEIIGIFEIDKLIIKKTKYDILVLFRVPEAEIKRIHDTEKDSGSISWHISQHFYGIIEDLFRF